jgi:hypothetical protein
MLQPVAAVIFEKPMVKRNCDDTAKMLKMLMANRQQYDDATFISGIKTQFDFKTI